MSLSPQSVARVVGVETQTGSAAADSLFLPQRVAMIGQGESGVTYSNDAVEITSRAQARELFGAGSPLAHMASVLKPPDGGGLGGIPLTAYPLQEGPAAAPAVGRITIAPRPGAFQEVTCVDISIGGIVTSFCIPVGATTLITALVISFELSLIPDLPVVPLFLFPTPVVQFTAKWDGGSGNEIPISVEVTSGGSGKSWTVTPMAGGTPYSDVQPALDAIGDKWETVIVNGSGPSDSAAFDAYEVWGLGRWGPVNSTPAVIFTGQNDPLLANSVAIAALHLADRTNSMPIYNGSRELPWVIAATYAAQIAVLANENPAQDYARSSLDPLLPGEPDEFFDYEGRNDAVSAGLSTTRLVAGRGQISDTVTFYHVVDAKVLTYPMSCGEALAACGEALAACGEFLLPNGVALIGVDSELSAFRYVTDIMKLMNCIYAIRKVFESESWYGSPLVGNSDPVINPLARTPKAAIAALSGIVNSLASSAVLTDPESTFKTITANATDEKRLDLGLTVKIASVSNIVSVELGFGFSTG